MRSSGSSFGKTSDKGPSRFLILSLLLFGLCAGLSIFSATGAQDPIPNVAEGAEGAQQTCTVNCTASAPASGSTGQPIAFSATGTPSGCATAAVYQWSFGDGTTSNQQNPSHTFTTPGTFNWTMTVSASSAGGAGSTISTVAGGENDGSPSLLASFYRLTAVTHDPLNRGIFLGAANVNSNVVYFINTSSTTVNLVGTSIAPGIVRVVAGGGDLPDGDNVSGIDLALSTVPGLAVSTDGGTLFFVERTPSRLRALNLTNGIARIVSSAGFSALRGISAGGDGLVYGADAVSPGQIVRINPNDGSTSPVAVNAMPVLANPHAVEVIGSNILIADTSNTRVLQVPTGGGTAQLLAVIPSGGRGGGFPAGLASFAGTGYVANGDIQTIMSVAGGGQTIAGTHLIACSMPPNSCGDGGPVSGALFTLTGSTDFSGGLPDIAGDANGIYVIDQSVTAHARVRYMNLSGAQVTRAGITIGANTIRTIAGTGAELPFDGGLASSAFVSRPTGVAVDAAGNLWIADTGNNRLRFVNRGTAAINVLGQEVGPGQIVTINNAPLGNTGVFPANNLLVRNPQGIFANSQGIFITDLDSGGPNPPDFNAPRTSRVHFVNTSGSTVNFYGSISVPPGQATTIAGGGGSTGDGPALGIKFLGVSDVVVNGAGDIYVTDSGRVAVRKISRANGIVTSNLISSTGLGLGPDGLVYAVNRGSGALFRETAVGSGIFALYAGGLADPRDVAVATNGTAYVTLSNHRIVQIATNLTQSPFAGTTQGFFGDGGAPTAARLDINPPNIILASGPNPITAPQTVGIAVGPGGEVLFTDTGNNRIRRVGSASTVASCVRNGTINITSNNPVPTLTTLSPMSILAGSGQFSLVLTGTGFVQGSQVRWNGNARTTTFNSPTQLTATIPATDVTSAGASTVTVFNPAPGGGASGGLTFTTVNPMPVVTSLSPTNAVAGSAAFELTVNGAGFVSTSVVRWNGVDKTTTFVNGTQLKAAITQGDVATQGTRAVTVFNPTPGGGISGGVNFAVNPPSAQGREGDVTPRPNGNGAVDLTDYVQLGRFAAGLDTVTPGSEFQKADCAPRSSLGNGSVGLDDYVQAGRYAAGLDPATTAGGPTGQSFAPPLELVAIPRFTGATQQDRVFRVVNATITRGQNGVVTVEYDALGDEAAIGFSVNFQTTQLTFVSAAQGSGVPSLIVNSQEAALGQVGFIAVAGIGQTFPAGTRQIVNITFNATTTGTGTSTNISFGDDPIPRQIVALDATNIPISEATFNSGTITLQGGGSGNPVPAITSIAPPSVQAGGAQFMLTVNGTNFVNGAVVRVNGVARTTSFGSANQLTATIPATDITAVGTRDITVFNPTPGGGTSNTVQLTITAAPPPTNPVPSITSIAPASVQAGGAQFALTVNGTNFVNGAVVRVNGADRTTSFGSANQLTATIPASDIATVAMRDITVFNPAPGGGTSNTVQLNVTAAPPPPNPLPTLTSINPTSTTAGSAAFNLTLTGTNFINGSQVQWNGTPLTTTFNSALQLMASVPANLVATVGSANVTVVNPAPGGGTSAAQTIAINSGAAGPTITGFNPSSAIAGGSGFRLFVSGTNFIPGSIIRFDGTDRPDSRFESTTTVSTFLSPAEVATARTINVTVFTPGPEGGTSNQAAFQITPPPSITSVSPNPAIAGSPDFTLTVNGVNFVSGSTVYWNDQPRTTTFVNSTQLRATILASDVMDIGMASVVVEVPNFGFTDPVTVNISTGNPIPSITSLNPSTVAAGSGQFTLNVTGAGFVNGSVVRWNGSDRTTVFGGPTSLMAAITAADVQNGGVAQVTVFNPAPGGGTSNAVNFTIQGPNPAPAITTISPSGALVGGPAFTLTINGSNFVPGAIVRFNNQDRTPSSVSSTQIMVAIPASDIAVTGTFPVQVVNPGPGGGPSNTIQFAVGSPNPVPTLTSLQPNTLPQASPGFVLTVTGTNFVNGSVVRWNGANRQTSFVSSTQLTAQIPAGDVASPGTASVTVFNPEPSGGTSGPLTFTITEQPPNPAPSIQSLNPAAAIRGGQAFTLNVAGTGFVPNSSVLWNGGSRPTVFVNSNLVQALIPASDIQTAGTASIQVLNPAPGGGLSLARVFTIANALANVNAASFQPGMIAQGSIVAAFGLNLATGTASAATRPLPTVLLGTRVEVRDSAMNVFNAGIFFVSGLQVNWEMPASVALGLATVTITSGDGTISMGQVDVAAVAPGLFSATSNGQGLAAAQILRRRGGVDTFENVALVTVVGGQVVATPIPIDLGPPTDEVFLVTYATGVRKRTSLMAVSAQLGGEAIGVLFAGDQGTFIGVDQINTVRIPRSFAGRGLVNFVVTVDNKVTNTVQVSFR